MCIPSPETHEAEYDVTIATVCYNAAAHLPRCIESVQPLLRGESVRAEHLIVDGASTDGTLRLLEEAQRAGRITRYVSEKDEGIYDAMNKALRLARGRVIVYINADDEIVPSGVPAAVNPILCGECAYCVGRVMIKRENGGKPRYTHEDMREALLSAPYGHPGLFVSTELLRRMGGFTLSPDLRIAADAELMGRLYLTQQPMKFTGELSAIFYIGGVSTQGYAPRMETLKMMCRNTEAICERLRREPRWFARIMRHIHRDVSSIEAESGHPLPRNTQKALHHLIRATAAVLPPLYRHRFILQCMQQRMRLLAAALLPSRSSRKRRRQADLCRLIAGGLRQAGRQ